MGRWRRCPAHRSVRRVRGHPGVSQNTDFYLDGELLKSGPFQGVNVWDLPDGDAEVRVVNTATHDGSALASSTKTLSEWTFTTSGSRDDWSFQFQPMIQTVYDIETDAAGMAGVGRKKGEAVPLSLELGHVAGAVGSGAMTEATLEVRVSGTDWKPVPLELLSADDSGPGEAPGGIFAEGRAWVSGYEASLPVPDAGAWLDLRVTATDAAGNTFSQEIERAVQVAPVNHGAVKGGPTPLT
ncbi:hypothetical protein [Agromyces flavus]|uniref:hypothetical protein n=1 Tax=Agromyces flavus TaxID=589382 RepID=UPI000B84ABF5|nr:hypothetical protein [Agromyces flavus]